MTEKIRILIIDDDKYVLEPLRDILQEKGYMTETAKTGKEALTKAENLFFNVALIDMKLPDMNGTEVLRNLKNKYPSMITIILTGHATLQNTMEALNLGGQRLHHETHKCRKRRCNNKEACKEF